MLLSSYKENNKEKEYAMPFLRRKSKHTEAVLIIQAVIYKIREMPKLKSVSLSLARACQD